MGVVEIERRGRFAVVWIDNPPVAALSTAVRAGLLAAARRLAEEPDCDAVVLGARGRTFVAGADVKEFGLPPAEPFLPEVIAAIEASPVPWVAALHGTALGGGFELALGCAARLAVATAEIGLPEVKLGIVPGAGGTQRLPRLVDPRLALDLVTSGRRLKAAEALAAGAIDAVVAGDDPVEAVLAHLTEEFARPKAARTLPRLFEGRSQAARARREAPARVGDREAFDRAAVEIRRRARGEIAPVRAAELVAAALDTPLPEGLARERAVFLELRGGPQAAALRHAFFAEREVGRVPGLDGVAARPVATVGVVGAGTMGAGIAAAFLEAGFTVGLVETSEPAAEAGRARVVSLIEAPVAKGRLSAAVAGERLARLSTAWSLGALAGADLVVEAVFEDVGVKSDLLGRLGALTRPGTVLATNTSYLDVDVLALASGRPEDVIGLHFFAPANVMRLVEVVKGRASAPDAVATGLAVARRLGKVGVLAGNAEGFIGNRLWFVYRRAFEYMVEDGASPYEIDAAMREFGFPMGPFQVSDLSGLDIAAAQRRRRAPTRPAGERYVEIADALVAAGRLGRKSGSGWYGYSERHPNGAPDPEVLDLVDRHRAEKGIVPVAFAPETLRLRGLAALVNEGAKALADGTARRALDIDVVFLTGYGFPAFRGGPMFAADEIGLATILEAAEANHGAGGVGSEPAPLLRRLVEAGARFRDLPETGI